MSFLQTGLWWLFPLAALPIIIHLLHQRRYRTVPWGATMFLLDAKRQSRGMARLRHFLILAMRVLAILALAFAIKRPLWSGSMGWAFGGAPDTVIVLLDRSASMEHQDLTTGNSKRSTALAKLTALLKRTGKSSKLILVESTSLEPQELESAEALLDIPATDATATSADIAGMLQVAQDYVSDNQTGRTDIWVCSDLAENDWKPDSGRWDGVREGFETLDGVRFYLLTYTTPPKGNYGVTVENVSRRQANGRSELILDIRVDRSADLTATQKLQLEIVVEGTRSVATIEVSEDQYVMQGYAVPIDNRLTEGWGSVSLPTDANPTDNTHYFVFAEEPQRQTVIISDDDLLADAARIATSNGPSPDLEFTAEVLPSTRAAEIPWESAGLIIWHAALPDGAIAKLIESHVDSGRNVIFLPPEAPGDKSMYGVRWTEWNESPDGQPLRASSWRDDAGLLANTQSGSALPVGELQVFRYCGMEGPEIHLAAFEDGSPLLTRVSTDHGGVFFLSTLPKSGYSTLATDGVVYYVMLHRALDQAARALSPARSVTAGREESAGATDWEPLDPDSQEELSVLRPYRTGVFRNGEQLFAINRDPAEDAAKPLDETTLEPLFGGLDYQRIEDDVSDDGALASEIWRLFLIVMALAMILEAALCIPAREQPIDHSLFPPTANQR